MVFKQLVAPDINITEKAGLCLQFTRKAFHAPAVEATAWQAWQNVRFKHTDRDFPENVSFPVWFDWWGQLGTDTQKFQYGHVAVKHEDGRIYSSPLSGVGRAWFNSIDDLLRTFGGGMTYIGWSEDISGVKVIEGGNNMTKDQAVNLAHRIGLLAHMSEAEITVNWLEYHAKHIMTDVGYAAALAKQLYEGKQWQEASWKAVHYDEDVAKAQNSEFVKAEVYIKK